MNDDEIELQPPSPQEVARRALVLSALVCRGNIDKGAGDDVAEVLARRLKLWLSNAHLENSIEPWEAQIFEAKLGTLDIQQIARSTWAAEGLAVLAWGLNQQDFPRHDRKIDPFEVTGAVGFLSDEAKEIIAEAELRSFDALRASREVMYAIHCRLDNFLRYKTPRSDFASWMTPDLLDAINVDPCKLIVSGDLGINGKAISDSDANAIQQCEWTISEQHRASIWLIGEEFPTYWNWTVET